MRYALILSFCLLAAPALAEDPAPDDPPGLLEEGARLFLRGLIEEMDPAMKRMREALRDMEPAFNELKALIDDIRNYDAPEMLPNGDIIIRRKPVAPPPAPQGEVEL